LKNENTNLENDMKQNFEDYKVIKENEFQVERENLKSHYEMENEYKIKSQTDKYLSVSQHGNLRSRISELEERCKNLLENNNTLQAENNNMQDKLLEQKNSRSEPPVKYVNLKIQNNQPSRPKTIYHQENINEPNLSRLTTSKMRKSKSCERFANPTAHLVSQQQNNYTPKETNPSNNPYSNTKFR
jgi:regulator of replication initiation timing